MTKNCRDVRATEAGMTLGSASRGIVTPPCSAQSSPPILSSLPNYLSNILCCTLCGDRLLVKFLGPTTVRGLCLFSLFQGHVSDEPSCSAPLGSRRRFGPAPVEDNSPPQLAQPSPSTYSKTYGNESPAKSREESPSTPAPGKWNTFTTSSLARE